MNKFLKEFKDRGYFYQCTNENELSDLIMLASIPSNDVPLIKPSAIKEFSIIDYYFYLNMYIKNTIYE